MVPTIDSYYYIKLPYIFHSFFINILYTATKIGQARRYARETRIKYPNLLPLARSAYPLKTAGKMPPEAGSRPPVRHHRQYCYRDSIMHTASAAIPSPRPVKPSFSVVVALTLTASSGTPAAAAIRVRISGI